MIPVMVLVQEDQVPDGGRKALEVGVEEFAQRHFEAEASIDWLVVPKGSGFTAAEPSTSVIVSVQANRALSQIEREQLITELYELSKKHTNRTARETVTAIRDPKIPGEV